MSEVTVQGEALNASLLQQTVASTALRRARDLAAIHHHVGANRIREAIVLGIANRGLQGAAVSSPPLGDLEIALP